MKNKPHLDEEITLWKKGYLVCGIDEVGRGSFAGPLVTAGVILKPIAFSDRKTLNYLLSLGINDSKLLTKTQRELIKELVQEYVLEYSIHYISVPIINAQGVGFANKMGFTRVAKSAKKNLSDRPIFYLSDAFKIPDIESFLQKNIIRGDASSISIALASIFAKIERDTYMEKLSTKFPLYGFEKHKGYGTSLHRTNLKLYGKCPSHRDEFVKNYLPTF